MVPANGHGGDPGALGPLGRRGQGFLHPCSLWTVAVEGCPGSPEVSQGKSCQHLNLGRELHVAGSRPKPSYQKTES